MKIAFPATTLSHRGTHVAIYDYAYFNQKILGNDSIIYINKKNPGPKDLINKFQNQFKCQYVEDWNDTSQLCNSDQCDAAYIIKSGELDHQNVDELPNFIHSVFPQAPHARHGHVYAFVSKWLSQECSNNRTPYVPHMINLPRTNKNLRQDLHIPNDATVFGCYGGFDSFNIKFVHKTIIEACEKNINLTFLFMNIDKFANHKQIIFLPATTDATHKANFITACDAMIHARDIGESFGLACGEFSTLNKPILTYGLSPQRAHLEILNEKALIYNGPKELMAHLLNFDRTWSKSQIWDCYSENYNPQEVMKIFSSVFLKPLKEKTIAAHDQLSFKDHFAIESAHIKRRLRSHSRKFHHKFS